MRAIILNFNQATHISLIQNDNYQPSPGRTNDNGEHKKRDNINT